MAQLPDPEAVAAQGYTPSFGDRFMFNWKGVGPYKDYLDRLQSTRSTLAGRELMPLSVSQVPEPYQLPLATPEQFHAPTTSLEPSSIPSYKPSAMDFSVRQQPMGSPLTPPVTPFQSSAYPMAPPSQDVSRPPLTPPTPQPHLQPEQGPPQEITRQVLNPQAPANPPQRARFEADVQLQTKWPPGMASQNRMSSQQDMVYRGLVMTGMDPQEAMARSLMIAGKGEQANRAQDKEDRLATSAATRARQGDERIKIQQDALDLRKQAIKLTGDRLAYLKSREGKTDDLARDKFEHKKAYDQTLVSIFELMKDPESMDEEAKQLLRNNIAYFATGGEFDITQEVPPNLLNQLLPGWNIGAPKTTIKPKQGGAPQGAPSSQPGGDQFPGAPPPGAPGSTLADKSGKPLARSDGKNWIPLK